MPTPLPSRNVHITYLVLFALSIVILNPFERLYTPDLFAGMDRLRIWVLPKMAMMGCIVMLNLMIILRRVSGSAGVADLPGNGGAGTVWFRSCWVPGAILLLLFVSVGVVATATGPMPLISFQGLWGGGLVYQIVLAVFVLSHMLIVRIDSRVLKYQGAGIVIGGIVLALSVIPQLFDWKIDYTLTSGIVIRPHMLASSIFQMQMPIGLYLHRGHAAFVLALVSLFLVMTAMHTVKRRRVAAAVYFFTGFSLFLCQSRGPQLALLIALLYAAFVLRTNELLRKHLIVFGGGILAAAFIAAQVFIHMPGLFVRDPIPVVSSDALSSGRLHMWELSGQIIRERPVFGSGFSGFSIAYPRFADVKGKDAGWFPEQVPVARMLHAHRHLFSYVGTDSLIHTGVIQATKAHNFLVDALVETGIAGTILTGALFMLFFVSARRRSGSGSEVFVVFYVCFLMTWYESAQYGHLPWWLMASGAAGGLGSGGCKPATKPPLGCG